MSSVRSVVLRSSHARGPGAPCLPHPPVSSLSPNNSSFSAVGAAPAALLGGMMTTMPAHDYLEVPLHGAALTCVGGPVPENSRVGRHKQRYNENGERLVAG